MNVKNILLITTLATWSSLFCSIAPKAPEKLAASLSFSAKEQSTPCANSQHTTCYFTTPAQLTQNPIKTCLWGVLASYLSQAAIAAGSVPCSRAGCTNTSAILQESENVVSTLCSQAKRIIVFSK